MSRIQGVWSYRGGAELAGGSSTMAIVGIVLVLAATLYLWRMRYLRSTAGYITVGAIIALLVYIGFFTDQPPV